MIVKIQATIDATLASLITLEDKQGKTHSKEWQRLEGYYYGLLDALNELEVSA